MVFLAINETISFLLIHRIHISHPLAIPQGSPLWLGFILLKFLLTLSFWVLFCNAACNNFVESPSISNATSVVSLLRPWDFVAVAKFDISLLLKLLVRAMNHIIDLVWHLFHALLRNMVDLEWVDRRRHRLSITKQIKIVLGPELLTLLKQKSWLNWGILFCCMLKLPPLFARHVFSKLGELTSMDSNRDISELSCVVGDHFMTALLIELLPGHLWRLHIWEDSESAVFSLIHPSITVLVLAYQMLHRVQIIQHLLSSILLEHRFWCNLGVLNAGQSWSIDFIFLVLDCVSQPNIFAGILPILLEPLLDWGEARLVSFAKFGIDIGLFVWLLIFLTLLLKCRVESINFLSVRSVAFLAELFHCSSIWSDFGQRMLRVSSSNVIKVIAIDDHATLLHDAEWALRSRLFHIPNHLVIYPLHKHKTMIIVAIRHHDEANLEKLTLRIASSASFLSLALSLPSPSLSNSLEITRSLFPTIPSPSRSKLISGRSARLLFSCMSVKVRLGLVLATLCHWRGILTSSFDA